MSTFSPDETRILEKNYHHSANKRTIIDMDKEEIIDKYFLRGIKSAIEHVKSRGE